MAIRSIVDLAIVGAGFRKMPSMNDVAIDNSRATEAFMSMESDDPIGRALRMTIELAKARRLNNKVDFGSEAVTLGPWVEARTRTFRASDGRWETSSVEYNMVGLSGMLVHSMTTEFGGSPVVTSASVSVSVDYNKVCLGYGKLSDWLSANFLPRRNSLNIRDDEFFIQGDPITYIVASAGGPSRSCTDYVTVYQKFEGATP